MLASASSLGPTLVFTFAFLDGVFFAARFFLAFFVGWEGGAGGGIISAGR